MYSPSNNPANNSIYFGVKPDENLTVSDWADAVALYEKAKTDKDLKKGFINTVLGEPFEEEFEAPDWKRLYEKRERYTQGVVPIGGLFLTAGVDIQKDRIECEIVAWGKNKQSWSVDYFAPEAVSRNPKAFVQRRLFQNRGATGVL